MGVRPGCWDLHPLGPASGAGRPVHFFAASEPAPPAALEAFPHFTERKTEAGRKEGPANPALTLVLLRPSNLLFDLRDLLQDSHGCRKDPHTYSGSSGSRNSGLTAVAACARKPTENSVFWAPGASGMRVRAGDGEQAARHYPFRSLGWSGC